MRDINIHTLYPYIRSVLLASPYNVTRHVPCLFRIVSLVGSVSCALLAQYWGPPWFYVVSPVLALYCDLCLLVAPFRTPCWLNIGCLPGPTYNVSSPSLVSDFLFPSYRVPFWFLIGPLLALYCVPSSLCISSWRRIIAFSHKKYALILTSMSF